MTRHFDATFGGATRAFRAALATAIVSVLVGLPPSPVFEVSLRGEGAPQQRGDPAGQDQDMAEFQKRVQDYVALHKKIEDAAPRLPDDATPEQMDAVLMQLSQGISTARATAKVGDIFTPGMQAWVRRTLEQAFSGPDGKNLRASILDENPIGMSVRVNGPYPDAIPLSTMPPKVIAALPKLPEELEFRFVGDRLILFDHHAHLIVDYVDRALPVV